MGKRVDELMADREPGDMPSPLEFRDAFDADARESQEQFKQDRFDIRRLQQFLNRLLGRG
jgi:hypothetical protein